jgi:hypothetical protein
VSGRLAAALLAVCVALPAHAQQSTPRARDLGVPFDGTLVRSMPSPTYPA